ncbi:hypothetical protein EVG20_g9252 [Dentipellis fragilis]|uniref:Uncharacterized protein n=1 Tax=Dentipellis fragilis TaxID=205917 RepID=A0A4Y9Y1N4_9AGAM|nr:hypothetical protein EVG20_g9252 [Dentipellis fragilis]
MAHSHRSHDFSWRDSPRRNSPTQAAHDIQRRNEIQIPSSGVYASGSAYSQVEREFVSDLQLARTRPASFAGSDLANALGHSIIPTRGAHNMPNMHAQHHDIAVGQAALSHHGHRQSAARSNARSSVARSSTQRHSADATSPHEAVFSVGHDYQEQWKAERPQPQPVASSSKAPHALAMTPRALAARKGRTTGAQDLYNLNKRLPDPWHRYDDPLNKRVIPKATEYIDHLEQTLRQKVKKLHNKDEQIEWFEHALEAGNIKCMDIERELHQRCEEIDYLRSALHQHGGKF